MNRKDIIGEATEYDKKLALEEKKPKSWCKSVSAFANTFGGALIFGISNEGMAVGLEDPEGDAEKISEVIKTRLEPIPEFKLRFHKTEDGRVLVILDVYKGDETPYYYSGDGVLEAYVRVGNESVKATATELKRLVLRGKNTSYDSRNSTYKANDYAFSKLKERYKKWTGNSFDDKDLISFGLVNEQGDLTNAGALLADESPILCSRLFCTRWNGLNKSGGTVDALDDAEYSGSVISLIENGEAFIKRNSKMKWRKTANSREEMPEYVERSYHEALVNALVHRDYLVNGSEVHIDIYDDRMEIYSPGGMPDGSMIRLTVSRYYTPTGRCIQKPYENGKMEEYHHDLIDRYNRGELMSADSIHFPDSMRYNTLVTERTVYGGGGIMPDVFIPVDTARYTDYHRKLVASGLVNRVSMNYLDRNRNQMMAKYPKFQQYKQGFVVGEDIMEELLKMAGDEKIEFEEEQYNRSKPLIMLQIKALIARDLYDMAQYFQIINDDNPSYQKALQIINNKETYNRLLGR